jgi:predicted Fe-Mo cluster-binding NifX family protein
MPRDKSIDETPPRVAVADCDQQSPPPLGRAARFVIFDIVDGAARTPCYRVRHNDPGAVCDGHADLPGLLRDCQVVIAGAAGEKLAELLRKRGIRVVATSERRPPADLVARFLAQKLARSRLTAARAGCFAGCITRNPTS